MLKDQLGVAWWHLRHPGPPARANRDIPGRPLGNSDPELSRGAQGRHPFDTAELDDVELDLAWGLMRAGAVEVAIAAKALGFFVSQALITRLAQRVRDSVWHPAPPAGAS